MHGLPLLALVVVAFALAFRYASHAARPRRRGRTNHHRFTITINNRRPAPRSQQRRDQGIPRSSPRPQVTSGNRRQRGLNDTREQFNTRNGVRVGVECMSNNANDHTFCEDKKCQCNLCDHAFRAVRQIRNTRPDDMPEIGAEDTSDEELPDEPPFAVAYERMLLELLFANRNGHRV
jgi:hypothetical protein